MSLTYWAYRFTTGLIAPVLPLMLNGRVRRGKEDPARLKERDGFPSRKRPKGQLVWLHGASVGESQVLLQVFSALKEHAPDLHGLITTQTLTSAELIGKKDLPDLTYQVAPFDTPFAAERFVRNWTPDLAILAEGDVWPNLMAELDKRNIKRMLINARMTDKSTKGWKRFSGVAQKTFGQFNPIYTANKSTEAALREILKTRRPRFTGNIKHAAAPLTFDEATAKNHRDILKDRPVLVAASTHPGEEERIKHAWETLRSHDKLAQMLLVIAPRHPERGADIAALFKDENLYHRSQGAEPTGEENIWLCDTLGELGLWFELSDVVYLGGGTPGMKIHGHNPIEVLKADRPVISGSDVTNFQDEFDDLVAHGRAWFADTSEDIAKVAQTHWDGTIATMPPPETLEQYFKGDAPLIAARNAALVQLNRPVPDEAER